MLWTSKTPVDFTNESIDLADPSHWTDTNAQPGVPLDGDSITVNGSLQQMDPFHVVALADITINVISADQGYSDFGNINHVTGVLKIDCSSPASQDYGYSLYKNTGSIRFTSTSSIVFVRRIPGQKLTIQFELEGATTWSQYPFPPTPTDLRGRIDWFFDDGVLAADGIETILNGFYFPAGAKMTALFNGSDPYFSWAIVEASLLVEYPSNNNYTGTVAAKDCAVSLVRGNVGGLIPTGTTVVTDNSTVFNDVTGQWGYVLGDVTLIRGPFCMNLEGLTLYSSNTFTLVNFGRSVTSNPPDSAAVSYDSLPALYVGASCVLQLVNSAIQRATLSANGNLVTIRTEGKCAIVGCKADDNLNGGININVGPGVTHIGGIYHMDGQTLRDDPVYVPSIHPDGLLISTREEQPYEAFPSGRDGGVLVEPSQASRWLQLDHWTWPVAEAAENDANRRGTYSKPPAAVIGADGFTF